MSERWLLKKVVANAMQSATTWRRRRDSNPRNAFDVYTISNRAPSTKLGDSSKENTVTYESKHISNSHYRMIQ